MWENNDMANRLKVLIIDYNKKVAERITESLQNYGYCVCVEDDKERIFEMEPDIVLIHEDSFRDGPLHNGHHIQKDNKWVPVILIVSDRRKANAIAAFRLNVADCVMFDMKSDILVQRIQRSLTTLSPEKPKIPLGRSLYLPQSSQILCDNEDRIDLLSMENKLLSLLSCNRGEICGREELITALWNKTIEKKDLPPSGWRMNLDSLVYSLRKRLENLDYVCIENVKKKGYRLLVIGE